MIAALLGLACLVAALYTSYRLFGDAFSPIGLFVGVMVGTFTMYQAGAVDFVSPTWDLYLMLAVIIGAFTAGALVADAHFLVRGVSAFQGAVRRDDREAAFVRRFFIVTAVLGTLGWMALGYSFSLRASLIAAVLNPALLQDKFQTVPVVGYLNTLNVLVGPAFVLLWKRYGYLRRWMFVALFSAVVGMFLAGIKAYMVFGMGATALTLFSFNRSPAHVLRMGALGLFGIGFFVIYNLTADQGAGAGRPVWQVPYTYFAGGWPALNELITGQEPYVEHVGQQTLYTVHKFENVVVRDPDFPSFNLPFTYIPDEFNVYTIAGEPFFDFGWAGVAIVLLVIGFLVTRVRLLALRTDRAMDHLLAGMASLVVLMGFFAGIEVHTVIQFIIVYIVIWRVFESRHLRFAESHVRGQ